MDGGWCLEGTGITLIPRDQRLTSKNRGARSAREGRGSIRRRHFLRLAASKCRVRVHLYPKTGVEGGEDDRIGRRNSGP